MIPPPRSRSGRFVAPPFLLALLSAGLWVSASGQEVPEIAPPASGPWIDQSLEVPDFVPPPPVPPRTPPERMVVRETLSHPAANDRRITIQRGSASELPDLPLPKVPAAEEESPLPLTSEELAVLKEQHRRTLSFGATIYDRRWSRLNWTHPETGEVYEALCGFDVGLLEGIGEFADETGRYPLLLVHSHMSTEGFRRVTRAFLPEFPEVPPGEMVILRGDPDDSMGTAPVHLFKGLIERERDRLVVYQEQRRRYFEDKRAWEEAHPEPPRDETIWLRPHRGSRYLHTGEGGGR